MQQFAGTVALDLAGLFHSLESCHTAFLPPPKNIICWFCLLFVAFLAISPPTILKTAHLGFTSLRSAAPTALNNSSNDKLNFCKSICRADLVRRSCFSPDNTSQNAVHEAVCPVQGWRQQERLQAPCCHQVYQVSACEQRLGGLSPAPHNSSSSILLRVCAMVV